MTTSHTNITLMLAHHMHTYIHFLHPRSAFPVLFQCLSTPRHKWQRSSIWRPFYLEGEEFLHLSQTKVWMTSGRNRFFLGYIRVYHCCFYSGMHWSWCCDCCSLLCHVSYSQSVGRDSLVTFPPSRFFNKFSEFSGVASPMINWLIARLVFTSLHTSACSSKRFHSCQDATISYHHQFILRVSHKGQAHRVWNDSSRCSCMLLSFQVLITPIFVSRSASHLFAITYKPRVAFHLNALTILSFYCRLFEIEKGNRDPHSSNRCILVSTWTHAAFQYDL